LPARASSVSQLGVLRPRRHSADYDFSMRIGVLAELTDDKRVHERFLEVVREEAHVGA